jgi:hypothetical protein
MTKSSSEAEKAREMAAAANATLDPPDPSPEWVTISNPSVEGPPASVTKEAFEEVWEPRGWVLEAESSPAPAPAGKPSEGDQ